MTLSYRYYLRDRPRTLYRVETESELVEVWSLDGWHSTSISMEHLDAMSHQEVNANEVYELTASLNPMEDPED